MQQDRCFFCASVMVSFLNPAHKLEKFVEDGFILSSFLPPRFRVKFSQVQEIPPTTGHRYHIAQRLPLQKWLLGSPV